jgi:hypothetical protein
VVTEVHDKIIGRMVTKAPGALILGRYGEVTSPTGPGSWTPVVHGSAGWPGAEECPTSSAVAEDEVVDHVVGLLRTLVPGSTERDRPLNTWLDRSPLLLGKDVMRAIHPHPVERSLNVYLGDLAEVCRSPHARLRTEHQLMSVSMVRRISTRTVTYLAQHSETWAARKRDGVHPHRLLGPITVADVELVENRIVATLVDELWVHTCQRLARLRRITSMLDDVRRYLDEAADRPWRSRIAAFEHISRLLRDDKLDAEVDRACRAAESLRSDLSALLQSPLRAAVTRPLNPGLRVPATNLFVNDSHYRRCATLWEIWAGEQRHVVTRQERVRRLRDWCAGFDTFVAVLVVQGLARLGLTPVEGAAAPRPGRVVDIFDYRGERLALDWCHDGAVTLLRNRNAVVRLVPIPHCLTAAQDPGEVRRTLDALVVPDHAEGIPIAVIYPGDRTERAALPSTLQQRAHHYRTPAVGAICAVVPVSPLEIDSVDRVARTLRWAVDQDLYQAYPFAVTAGAAEAAELAAQFTWVRRTATGIEAHRAPGPRQREQIVRGVTAVLARVNNNRRVAGMEQRASALSENLGIAADRMTALTYCPLCRKQSSGPDRTMSDRDDSTYHCVCEHCGGTWETRFCRSCGSRFPVLTTTDTQKLTGGPEHVVEKQFSHDVLAAPCWSRPRVYLCSSCGTCAAATKTRCVRCTPTL